MKNTHQEPILEIRDLSVCFRGGSHVQAVEGVSLTVFEGDRLAIIGETGSGKSILLLSVLRLLPRGALVTGQALYRGENLFAVSPKRLNEIRGGAISYVPQGSGNGMNPLLRVGFQVAEPMMAHRGTPRKEAERKSVALLKKFHLGREEELARQYPFTFSGGMRQRALIAMGVAADAEMLFADEPTKGLDERRIQTVVDSFNALEGQTILCVTHDLNFARSIASRISVMYAANQVELAPADELFHHPLHPYTQDMMAAMPENGLHFNPGFAPSHDHFAKQGCKYAERCRERRAQCSQVPPLIDVNGHQVRCWKYA